MRWEEPETGDADARSFDVAGAGAIDAAFRLSGRWLPVDHACALRAAVVGVLPWLGDEPDAGIHSIHGAASGNGWERPGNKPGELLSLSRRTPLVLRVPARRAGDVAALCGRRLEVGGYALTVGALQSRRLRPASTVFARYVVDEDDDGEERFIERTAAGLDARSISARKLLCGRESRIESEPGPLTARSLLIADLDARESLALQCRGIGPERLLGCGLFVPCKDVGPAGPVEGRR